MHLSFPLLTLTLAALVTAVPLSPLQAENNACYYKRSVDAYVRRDASNAEVLCGKQTQQQNGGKQQKRAPIPPQRESNNACYYKRDIDAYVRRDATNAEILCAKSAVPAPGPPTKQPSNNACYYKRHSSSGKTVGYKRDASGSEILCQAAQAE